MNKLVSFLLGFFIPVFLFLFIFGIAISLPSASGSVLFSPIVYWISRLAPSGRGIEGITLDWIIISALPVIAIFWNKNRYLALGSLLALIVAFIQLGLILNDMF